MAKNFLESIQGLDLGGGLSASRNLSSLTDLAQQPTSGEVSANQLEGLGNQLQASTPLTAILKGVTQGVVGEKRSKAQEERDAKIAAIEQQTQYMQQQAQWADAVKQKLQMHQLSEAERVSNQSGIDEGLRLAVDFGDPTAIAEIVKANPGMKGVLDDTLPDGVVFEGINFDQQNGTLVPYGRDAEGNVMYGQGQKWERFASPTFMQQRAQSLYDSRVNAAELAKAEAEVGKIGAEAAKAGAEAANTAAGKVDPSKAAVIEKSLRDDFQAQSKEFGTVADFYQRGQQGFKEGEAGNGSGDMKLVFSYMKTLDPTSVVREGEYANAATVGSVPDKIVQQYNSVLQGAKLGPQARQQIMEALNSSFADKAKQQQENEKNYRTLAERKHLNPDDVMIGVPSVAQISPSLAGVQPPPGLNLKSPEAANIKSAFQAGKITREQAKTQLQALGGR